MIRQPMNTVFKSALAEIDSGTLLRVNLNRSVRGSPDWTPAEKARKANEYVNLTLNQMKHELNAADWRELRMRYETPIETLSIPERTRMGEKIAERTAQNLDQFMEVLESSIPRVRAFRASLSSDLSPRDRAVLIRAWLNENREWLGRGDELGGDITARLGALSGIPPEITVIFSRLSTDAKTFIIMKSMSDKSVATFRSLVMNLKNDPRQGPAALITFFNYAAQYGHLDLMIELSQLPEFRQLPKFVSYFGFDQPSSWFEQALCEAQEKGNIAIIDHLRGMENATGVDQQDFNDAFQAALLQGNRDVIFALGRWPQAANIRPGMVALPNDRTKLALILSWAVSSRNIQFINAMHQEQLEAILNDEDDHVQMISEEDFQQIFQRVDRVADPDLHRALAVWSQAYPGDLSDSE